MDPRALLALEDVEEVELPATWQPIETVLGAAGVTEVPLPDGMGFGGADVWSGRSLDGTFYAVLCVERPGLAFGTYAFRRFPDGRREWVQLLEFTEGRVTVGPERGVAILTWLSPNSRGVRYGQLPGFVSPDAGGVATPISIVPTAGAPSGGGGGVDQGARDQVASLKKTVAGLATKVAALEARPATAPVNVDQIRDVIWNLPVVVDRIYQSLVEENAGLVGQIERIARRAIGR